MESTFNKQECRDKIRNSINATDAGCWEWAATINNWGYGILNHNSKTTAAHRLSYEVFVGSIPSDMDIDHLCRNRVCVNPEHLEPVSRKENVLRGEGRTAKNARKTHCPRGHEFTDENTIRKKRDSGVLRECRKCHNDRRRKTNNYE